MNEIIGITFVLTVAAYLFWGVSVGKVPFTVENVVFWGIGLGITAFGISLLLAEKIDNAPDYMSNPNVGLRLTSRPIGA